MMTLAGFYATWGEHLQTVLIVIVAAFIIMYIQTVEGSLKRNGGANGATMTWVLGVFWSNGIENSEGESQSKQNITSLTDRGATSLYCT
jgi:hypothetical protein